MPKSRSSHNTISSSTTSTLTILPTILHLNQHHRTSSSSSSSSSAVIPHYIHNTSYGLLEPAQAKRPSLHHRRKSSSSTSSSTWSDRGFDLTDLKDKSVGLGEKISERVPGVRYSATFFSTLRQNLALSASLAPPSPSLHSLHSPSLPPNTFFPASAVDRKMVIESDSNPLDNVPELMFSPPATEEDRTAGLKLVADIYSQQRSSVSKILIYNPLTVLLWSLLVGAMYPFVYRDASRDKPNLAITIIGMLMFVLAGVRFLVRPYQELADTVNWEWLGGDEMCIAKFGDTVIGSAVYRFESDSKRKAAGKKMLIRAWTTRPRERQRGVGKGLLEKLVDIAKAKGCTGLEFAPEDIRVGSEKLLTWLDGFLGVVRINSVFERDELKARRMLKNVLDERWEKRRRGSK